MSGPNEHERKKKNGNKMRTHPSKRMNERAENWELRTIHYSKWSSTSPFAISINYKNRHVFWMWCMGHISVCTILSAHYIYYGWKMMIYGKMIFDWYYLSLSFEINWCCKWILIKFTQPKSSKTTINISFSFFLLFHFYFLSFFFHFHSSIWIEKL